MTTFEGERIFFYSGWLVRGEIFRFADWLFDNRFNNFFLPWGHGGIIPLVSIISTSPRASLSNSVKCAGSRKKQRSPKMGVCGFAAHSHFWESFDLYTDYYELLLLYRISVCLSG